MHIPLTSFEHQSGNTTIYQKDLTKILPENWPLHVPLVQVITCGTLSVNVLHSLQNENNGELMPTYAPVSADLLAHKGVSTALTLLAVLVSKNGFATKDWLSEKLYSVREEAEDEDNIGMKRIDNVVSLLRTLLTPPLLSKEGTTSLLRRHLVSFERASSESGPGYRLMGLPLVWIDVEQINMSLKRARALEQFGQDARIEWQYIYDLAMRGSFLVHEPYSDWAKLRRQETEVALWESVQALWRSYAREDNGGERKAVHLLRDYWLTHMMQEDALRPLLELLGKQEHFGEAEDLYARLIQVLDEEERVPDRRTTEIMEYLRAMQIQRLPNHLVSSHALPHEGSEIPINVIGDPDTYSLASSQRYTKENMKRWETAKGSAIFTLSDSLEPVSQYWSVPYLQNPFFTGRDDLLMRLYDIFHSDKTVIAVTQHALCGLGGIGKTQIALEYVYRYRQKYRAIFWMRADTRENLKTDFLALAPLLALPERDAQDPTFIIKAIQKWLREHTKWLLVFDNADDLEILKEILPTGCLGHVLITTRAQSMGTIAHRLEIEEMSQDIGTLFLLRRAGIIALDASLQDVSEKDCKLAGELVQELGGLPLALDQAGAYIEEASVNIEEYRDLYRQQNYELLKRRGGLVSDHQEPVATTWALSFARVEQMDNIAGDILRYCAFVNADAIPEEIFTRGASTTDSSLNQLFSDASKLHRAVEVLRKFSLIRRHSETKILTIHRLVQASIQGAMTEEMQHVWATKVINAISAVFPSEITVTSWPSCLRLLPQVQMALLLAQKYHVASPEAALLFNQAGYYLREQALYKEAELFYKAALAMREHIFGISHSETAQVLYNLARLYFDLGQYDLCETFHQQALAIREQAISQDHLAIALSLNSLAFLYYLWNVHLEKAEHLFQRALLLFKQTIGIDHPKTSHCLSNLALLYAEKGQYTEAEQLLLQVNAIRAQYLGTVHVDTARGLQNLAWLYMDQGRPEFYSEAKQLFEQALHIREQLLGHDHPQTAISLHHLALFYEVQEQYEEADHLYQRVLSIRRLMMGQNNPRVLWTEMNYITLLRKMGKFEQANALDSRIRTVQGSKPHALVFESMKLERN